MPTPEQRGDYVERFIAGLSSMFFFNDFVFHKPSYKTHGQKREVTDIMLVLGQECMFVSVKGTDGEEKTVERFRLWAQKKAGQAARNARVACQRATRVDVFGKNLWGEERTFAAASLTPLCGLALVECTQEIFAQIPLPKVSGPDATVSYPVHTLSINDFLNVVMLLGSIWDVFNYFKRRATVSHLLPGLNTERPLVCYYTLKSREDFSGFRAEDAGQLAELHQLFLLDKLSEFGERDRLAGYINAVVHQLHTRHRDFEQYAPPEFRSMIEPANRRQAYLGLAARLNALPISNKAWLGRQIERCIDEVRRAQKCKCFLYKQLLGEVVFVFAVFVGWSRREKLRGLSKLLPAAQYSTGMIEALGVAYEDKSMGFDLLWRRGPIEDAEGAAALAKEVFSGQLETQCPTPFGDPRPYVPSGVSGQNTGKRTE